MARLLNHAVDSRSTSHLFDPISGTMILASNSPPVQGGQAPTQRPDPETSGTTALLELPDMRTRAA